ncbi:MAG: glycosyltransferase [Candidatus Pedobacter colombiensis]|uniref:Glycosyltransferase n=1 Tax=Candidatus Pedobacter colombiensis TaxID=3121371 RepID=A0AAJ6B8V7_9SPHI|nr:glycosyltransferase [Pedobacter sp.]WEK21289.1 MAG: glycosyltransferase [Pedobacter sp.]
MNSPAQKLLFISMSNYAGGAENILRMAAAVTNNPLIFLKRLFNSRLLIPKGQSVQYLTEGPMLIGFLMLVKALYPYRKGYTIISTHPYLNSYLGLLKRIGYIKSNLIVRECTCVFTRYTGVKRLSYQIAYKLGYPAVNLIICQTEIMRNQLLKQNKFIPNDKILIKENPIDLNQILKKAEEPLYENLEDSDFICTAGRLIPEKGFSILIRAFANIAGQYKNLKLLILGEGRERERLHNLIKETGLEGRVILKGHIDNPVSYFKKAKLCVVSSIIEGFPNVLLEMMAVNDAVISTLCAGGIDDIPSIIKVEVNNIQALSQAIKALIIDREINKVPDRMKYLKSRTPKIFINSILKEAKRVNYQF